MLTGNPSTEWDIPDAGDPTIQGFGTDISVNRGSTVTFKINTTAAAYRIDIYRLGYYGGLGARKVATINPSVSLPQVQPQCLTDPATALIDCGNWKVSASWTVPSTATSGVYLAKPVRTDTGGTSHIVFIVRDDASHSDLLFQTSDLTWQAYNKYGGTHIYAGNGPGTGGGTDGRGYKVSYNRPFILRGSGRVGGQGEFASWLFTLEYPMIRWLESNGYNVTYAAGMDTDRRGVAALTAHKTYLSVGHDEYWSGGERTNIEAARAAGVNLAFFSGNEMFWKTRWENSIDGTNTPYRTMVCYKETHNGAKIDPSPTWTGTWRDPRFSPPLGTSDGGRPENAVTGQIFTVNAFRADPIVVSSDEGHLRFWRNTGIDQLADGLTAQLPAGVLGDEWDEQLDNGCRPAGLLRLSTTTINPVNAYLQDYGSTYAPGTATHHLSLYRHSSGALVFGAGTIRWMWGLDSTHDDNSNSPNTAPDVRMQQATANLLADMGALPTTLRNGLVMPVSSTDIIPPTSTFLIPSSITVPAWSPMTVFGIATDAGGGVPAAVELSLDGGTTWHPVSGASNWGAAFTTGAPGSMIVKSRAVDDSARLETPGAGITINVTGNSTRCTLFPPEAAPIGSDVVDPSPEELGVRFKADMNGWITAFRYYKSTNNTGTHVGNLWSNTGALLATVTFANETSSGWQEMKLPTPVAVTAGTKYVASIHMDAGHFFENTNYFAMSGIDRVPLHAPATITGEPNGLYVYGASAFPVNSYLSGSNYWIDLVYTVSTSSDIVPPLVIALTPAFGEQGADPVTAVSAQFNEDIAPATVSSSTFTLRDPQGNNIAGTITYDAANRAARLQPTNVLSKPGIYTATVKGGSSGVADLAGNKLVADVIWSFTTGQCTLFPPEAIPTVSDVVNPNPEELGVRFKSDFDGWITALRFYKSAANVGTHTGHLWSNTGALLATVTFTNESGSGWQQAQLATPVAITAGTKYVASYHMDNGHYAEDSNYFAGKGVDRGPLHAPLDNATEPNGLYIYGASAFPTNTYLSGNYWVDVVYTGSNQMAAPLITPPAGTYPATLPVILESLVPGAQIYYTTNGTTPTTSSTRYTLPFTISSNTTVKAIAVASGWANSPVVSAAYTIQTSAPGFNLPAGSYSTAQSVALSQGTPGALIYYTTNGTAPTTSSTLYVTPISVSTNTTIKAIAVVTGITSPVSSAAYTFQAASPVFTPLAGSYSSTQSVTITDASPGSQIYYTTNGSTPTTSSTLYTGQITVSSNTTINAIAAVTGWANSAVVAAAYTITQQSGSPPVAPGTLTATAASSAQINLTWVDASNNETGFKLERKTGAAGTYAQIATPAANVTSYSDPSVSASTTYYYRVRATNASGDSGYSNEANATTPVSGALPAPWVDGDVGSVGLAGSATYASGNFTAKGAGADIWGNADAFNYVYQPMTGNAEIVAKVNSVQNTDVWAKAGVMIRETLSPGAEQALMAITSASGAAFQRRVSTGGVSTHTAGAAVTAPYWVRLVRNGNTFTGYVSIDGLSWTQVGTDTIAMVPTVYVGLAVTAHNATLLNQSVFSNVFLTTQPAAPSALTGTATSGTQVNLAWVDNSTNESGFKIERKTGAGGTYAQIATVAAAATSYSDTGLAVNTTYYYRVRSSNTAGDSPYSNEAPVTTPTAAPASLSAAAVSGTQINLSWSDVTGETGFKVERKTGSGGTYAQIGTVGANVTTYSDTGLTQSTAYYYRVRATNGSGDSAYSPEANATTSGSPPSAPATLTATTTTSTQISLSWADVSNETGFKIERKTGAGGTYAQIATVGANVTTYGDTGLTGSTIYFYRVRATNAGGDSPYSPEASATTSASPPSAPATLTATASSTTQINLSWPDVANETGYKIERKTGSGGTYAQIATVGANVVTYSDPGLTASTTYFYRVRANNAGGDSPYSPEASATTTASAPVAPASVTATTSSSTQINLSWSDVSNETGFKIERKTGAGGAYAQIGTTAPNVITFSDSGLTSGAAYFYRVRATNAVGDSPYSPETSATTLTAAPATLTATVASSSQINLSWANVSGETGFKIERKIGAGGTYAQIATTAADGTTYNNTGLTSGTTYFYRVRATNAGGDSAYSPEANATTSSSPPAFRSASSAGAASGTLTINKPSGTIQGDVMVATIAIRPNTATITASGWTLVRRMDNSSGNANSLAVYYKVAGASEPGSYAFSFSTSTGAVGGIRTFIGIDTANPVDVDAGQNTASSVNHAAPSVTTRYANDMIVTSHAFASSATFTPPSGMTEAFDVASGAIGSGGEASEGNYQLQASIGATGTRTATASNDADTGNAHTLALKSR